jgi:hypothetical protein
MNSSLLFDRNHPLDGFPHWVIGCIFSLYIRPLDFPPTKKTIKYSVTSTQPTYTPHPIRRLFRDFPLHKYVGIRWGFRKCPSEPEEADYRERYLQE